MCANLPRSRLTTIESRSLLASLARRSVQRLKRAVNLDGGGGGGAERQRDREREGERGRQVRERERERIPVRREPAV